MTVRILALDTCTETCSAAILVGDEIIEQHQFAPREHAKLLLPMAQQLLAQAALSLSQLDAIAFGRGPGSFTGVRICTSTAQGLAFGADLPLLPMSTLQALAQQGYRLSQVPHQIAAIDARMNEVYCGAFELSSKGMVKSCDERIVAPEKWIELLGSNNDAYYGVGSGWAAYPTMQPLSERIQCHVEALFPLAQDMAYLAQFAWQNGEAVDAAKAQPVYLRDTVTWKKLPGRE
ncbi:tRNA (adenosine(37)-N6)-threonylcarbamoyltransferase complex dimerization subunit type 1 TsaB [Echinimonas agarilytica]|uniref:tRNA threonylcarbamoyladenosine biosynthesis protein TsaB n=1 Tax=Echinimonas agarilytica TaxID=1215918 RepID=A0AA41W6A1_9GAMM|nr:tRNA (adenosine(37)-N6)-threonylcarbamoyltransferase complex dimerization subunit type 1 TsaB [Echinimonas agarilytica]MCM2679428.1 tRNA (adenosine(37)-N6)-threonylcarbamoyltransferase complex dimerization subunit type 1 TsaB [Echinimonas agarilytica]